MRGTKNRKIAVFDAETDPFLAKRIPRPFCCGFFDGETYLEKWGADCIAAMMVEIRKIREPMVVYVHNGAKFDFWSMWREMDLDRQLFVINGRLTEFTLSGCDHVFRDSFSIVPVGLEAYHKEKIDYRIMEKKARHLPMNAAMISVYLQSDCRNLHALVERFADRFRDDRGNVPISVGQASIRELMRFHRFDRMTEASDGDLRDFYMGGRVQCFASGVLEGPWKLYDLNSAYAAAMASYEHPLQDLWESLDAPPRARGAVWFAEFEGTNRDALPVKVESDPRGGDSHVPAHPGYELDFTLRQGRFFACSHELVPAIAAGMVRVDEWVRILRPNKAGRLDRFVNAWHGERLEAIGKKDKAAEIFAKAILQRSYGKAGQNPADFRDWRILGEPMGDVGLREDGFEPQVRIADYPFIELWSRQAAVRRHGYYNVSIAASVTSATRAMLMEGLNAARQPIYCDTDSLVCRSFAGDVDGTRLGAWKLECTAEMAAIAGKKCYLLYNRRGNGRIEPVKWASKGGDLSPLEILKLAKGGEVEKTADVPTYSLSTGISFQKRKFSKTAIATRKYRA